MLFLLSCHSSLNIVKEITHDGKKYRISEVLVMNDFKISIDILILI